MKNVTSIGNSVCVVGMEENLRIGRQVARMTVVVWMSIMVFFAMTLVPPIASADCPDMPVVCYKDNNPLKIIGSFVTGTCWQWLPPGCYRCASQDALNEKCNKTFSDCEGRCTATVLSSLQGE